MARRAGLRDERYALFIKGQTGSLKTSWTQAAMAIYIPRFLSDETLLRWGAR